MLLLLLSPDLSAEYPAEGYVSCSIFVSPLSPLFEFADPSRQFTEIVLFHAIKGSQKSEK